VGARRAVKLSTTIVATPSAPSSRAQKPSRASLTPSKPCTSTIAGPRVFAAGLK
jgi:hypothetical protein